MKHEGYGRNVTQGENFYQYNGKELNEDFGLDWYSYGFRSYDAAIGRFPSCDPIAENFAFVSPYNYAENNPSTGIDLYGLQFLSANDAKIEILEGGVALKYENLKKATQERINNANPIAGVDENGQSYITTDFPTWIEKFEYSTISPKRSKATSPPNREVQPVESPKFGGNAQQRKKAKKKYFRSSPPVQNEIPVKPKKYTGLKRGSGTGILTMIWAAAEGAAIFSNVHVISDYNKATKQNKRYARKAINVVEKHLNVMDDGLIIGNPPQMAADLANYVLQGEFTQEYNDQDKATMIKIAEEIMKNNDIPVRK